MAILIWDLEHLGDHHSSPSFPSTILWRQSSALHESEQALSSLGHFLINWCFGLCWHREEILCSLERSRLRTTEVLWSAKAKLLNMIHGQHLNLFRAPDAFILPGWRQELTRTGQHSHCALLYALWHHAAESKTTHFCILPEVWKFHAFLSVLKSPSLSKRLFEERF